MFPHPPVLPIYFVGFTKFTILRFILTHNTINLNEPQMENRRSFIRKSAMLLAASVMALKAFALPLRRKTPPATTRVVTLNVDTGRIQSQNTSGYCNFGQASGITNENYTIVANVGDTIVWQGKSSTSPNTDVVSISSINYEGGKNVFGQNILQGSDGKVTGVVQYNTVGAQPYKYKISFKVTNNGANRNGTFHIDPKIEVH